MMVIVVVLLLQTKRTHCSTQSKARKPTFFIFLLQLCLLSECLVLNFSCGPHFLPLFDHKTPETAVL